ncbi:hypothetical protein GCM10007285_21650 [Stappia taiwanensis]|nr:hypothetical protein GCM10007285_21650 [Stappia taiwanensis]
MVGTMSFESIIISYVVDIYLFFVSTFFVLTCLSAFKEFRKFTSENNIYILIFFIPVISCRMLNIKGNHIIFVVANFIILIILTIIPALFLSVDFISLFYPNYLYYSNKISY